VRNKVSVPVSPTSCSVAVYGRRFKVGWVKRSEPTNSISDRTFPKNCVNDPRFQRGLSRGLRTPRIFFFATWV
jgi:hypothetical protein